MRIVKKGYKVFSRNREVKNPKKILVFKVGAIGDVVMTTPFLEALRKKFTSAKIYYCVGKRSAAVLKNNPHIDELITFDDKIVLDKSIKGLLSLKKKIKKNNFDLGIVLDKSEFAGLFLRFSGVKTAVGFNREGEGNMLDISIPYNNEEHEVDQYLKIAYALGAKKINRPKVQTFISKKDEKTIDEILKKNKISKFIAIVPGGANNPAVGVDDVRRLPVKIWNETIKTLSSKYKIVLAGGPTDKDYNQQYIRKNVINLAGELSINESIALFKKAEVVICNDSGPMHMAASKASRMVTLFGATNPARKAPRYIKNISIWKDKKNYDPDYEFYGKQPSGKFMQKITAKDVLRAVEELLE